MNKLRNGTEMQILIITDISKSTAGEVILLKKWHHL